MDLQDYILQTYGIAGECPFARDNTTCVFRHPHNRKWFGIIMDIHRSKLGLPGDEYIPVVNVKCDTRLIGSFRQEKGIYPAYHMSKAHWLTIALDGTADGDKIKFLLDMSYELTK